MSRVLVVLVVVSLLLVEAVAAHAASVVRTGQSPDEISAYWSSEKMKGAVPRIKERGAKAKPGSTGPWTSLAVSLPYAGNDLANGKVFFTEGKTNYVCSGTSVATGSGSLVWTAGHCVNEGPGAYVRNFMFAPGWVDGTAPYGKWAASQLATTDGWAGAGDFDYDVGAARVVPGTGAPPSGRLGDITAPRSMTFNYGVTLNSTAVDAYGYPAAGRFDGRRQWRCSSTVVRRDGAAAGAPMGIPCDMTGGSSGGAWVIGGGVGSVNSYGYSGLKNVMFGPYQGAVAQALYAGMG